MTLRKQLVEHNKHLKPILGTIPDDATDDQIYFYLWSQDQSIVDKVPIPSTYSRKSVDILLNWLRKDVPAKFSDFEKLRPFTYKSEHYINMFRYCLNSTAVFKPPAISKIYKLTTLKTPKVLNYLLLRVKDYPVYQQYALAIAYYNNVADAYYNNDVFLNFILNGPNPPSVDDSLQVCWDKWGSITEPTVKAKPSVKLTAKPRIKIVKPAVNDHSFSGFTINSQNNISRKSDQKIAPNFNTPSKKNMQVASFRSRRRVQMAVVPDELTDSTKLTAPTSPTKSTASTVPTKSTASTVPTEPAVPTVLAVSEKLEEKVVTNIESLKHSTTHMVVNGEIWDIIKPPHIEEYNVNTDTKEDQEEHITDATESYNPTEPEEQITDVTESDNPVEPEKHITDATEYRNPNESETHITDAI